MSAIAGIVSQRGKLDKDCAKLVGEMLGEMRHRGPDNMVVRSLLDDRGAVGVNEILLTPDKTHCSSLDDYPYILFTGGIYNKRPEGFTDVEVVKEGQVRVAKVIESTSLINVGDYTDLLVDITILAWIRRMKYGYASYDMLYNGTLIFMLADSNKKLRLYSGGSSAESSTAIPVDGDWVFVAGARKANGLTSLYINGVVDGTEDQDSGTPVVGTQDITLGGRTGSARVLNGLNSETIILSGLLTPEEISQYYTATKHLYSK